MDSSESSSLFISANCIDIPSESREFKNKSEDQNRDQEEYAGNRHHLQYQRSQNIEFLRCIRSGVDWVDSSGFSTQQSSRAQDCYHHVQRNDERLHPALRNDQTVQCPYRKADCRNSHEHPGEGKLRLQLACGPPNRHSSNNQPQNKTEQSNTRTRLFHRTRSVPKIDRNQRRQVSAKQKANK